ncbi:GGDEF domain-containing protein [Devosia honganensis]|uniref:diguanylate cyclase n=1 Tax=Devosia honganensis TaxID=1610527 RepID=A0ABV7X119_9HYPH
MGLDNTTLFVANIVILIVAAAAYAWIWLRVQGERHWLCWIVSNLMFAGALTIYAARPELPVELAIWPDALLLLGFGLRLLAARTFNGRATALWAVCAPAACYVLMGMTTNSLSLNFATVNTMLALLGAAVGVEFWRDRADGLPSRYALAAIYGLMALSFALRSLQGLFIEDQIVTYIPYDILLEIHLLVALIYVAGGSVFVLSIAYERRAVALRQAALLDPLTGLPNRRAFEMALRALKREADGKGFALALFDIDHFKRINDRHGHTAGDEALRHFARACTAVLRETDRFFRIGGEEFALIVAEVTPEEAGTVVERVRAAANGCVVEVHGHALALTASAGVCHSALVGLDFDSLIEAADAQLYAAKNAGRDRTASAPLPAGAGRRDKPPSRTGPPWPDPVPVTRTA